MLKHRERDKKLLWKSSRVGHQLGKRGFFYGFFTQAKIIFGDILKK
jgi:hypothetical protein